MMAKYLDHSRFSGFTGQHNDIPFEFWRYKLEKNRRQQEFKRKIYGEHYNYQRFKMNPDKKHMKLQQKNTEIQRENRILHQKIRTIAKRSIFLRRKIDCQVTQKQLESYSQTKNCRTLPILPASKKSNVEKLNRNSNYSIDHSRVQKNRSKNNKPKSLFQKSIVFNSNVFFCSASINKEVYSLVFQSNQIKQNIEMTYRHYQLFFQRFLQGCHQKILDFLQWKGNSLEFTEDIKEIIEETKFKQQNIDQFQNS